jgi:hypothetical protein
MKYNLTQHLHHKDVKSFDVMGYDYHILKKLGFDVGYINRRTCVMYLKTLLDGDCCPSLT